jgi:hypothetical protein
MRIHWLTIPADDIISGLPCSSPLFWIIFAQLGLDSAGTSSVLVWGEKWGHPEFSKQLIFIVLFIYCLNNMDPYRFMVGFISIYFFNLLKSKNAHKTSILDFSWTLSCKLYKIQFMKLVCPPKRPTYDHSRPRQKMAQFLDFHPTRHIQPTTTRNQDTTQIKTSPNQPMTLTMLTDRSQLYQDRTINFYFETTYDQSQPTYNQN